MATESTSGLSDVTLPGNSGVPSTPATGYGKIYGIGTSTVRPGYINSSGTSETMLTTRTTGALVQHVTTNYSAVASGTTTIPFDDTIPQITEGTEFMTQAITPAATTNRLIIEATVMVSLSIVDFITMALFQDSTANAIAATSQYAASVGTGTVNLKLTHEMAAGTTSATTFRIRIGGSSASTLTFNGQSGARRLGGITLSNIRVTEIVA